MCGVWIHGLPRSPVLSRRAARLTVATQRDLRRAGAMSPVRASERSRYPANWQAISARIRFGRAGGRCECEGECGTGHAGRCAARHGLPHPVTGSRVVLTTAHLDHVPEHCSEANLRAMCQRCDLAYDAVHHAATAAATRAARGAQNRPAELAAAGRSETGEGDRPGGRAGAAEWLSAPRPASVTCRERVMRAGRVTIALRLLRASCPSGLKFGPIGHWCMPADLRIRPGGMAPARVIGQCVSGWRPMTSAN
jgi:hypothetical protein